MERNVGNVDKLIRVVVGVALIAMVFIGPQTPWGWLGLVPLGTAALGWCPLYAALGIRTCPVIAKPKM